MAGSSVTFTEVTHSIVKKIKAVWISDDAAGTASGGTSGVYNGRFIGLITVPSAVGGLVPSDNYTITITDSDGIDLLLGAATGNRDQTNTEFINEASMAGAAATTLTFAVSGAGNSKSGIIYLLVR